MGGSNGQNRSAQKATARKVDVFKHLSFSNKISMQAN
jgi:hypothetical protein